MLVTRQHLLLIAQVSRSPPEISTKSSRGVAGPRNAADP
jgi:hypothetical protein